MRPRSPGRVLERRRRARARVTIVDEPRSAYAEDGSIGSKQSAEVTLPRRELERMWSAEYLERLARTYWSFLTRFSLGILRVLYTEDAREVVVFRRPFVLLRFHKPEYHLEPDGGTVTWPIDKGLLVAPAGRGGRGYLRLSVSRTDPQDDSADEVSLTISSEVVNFYPLIAGWGWFAKVGRLIYNQTQLRIHVVVTHAFLRSLANLELEESRVGALSRASRPLSPAASLGRDEP
ncbi:MAG TPA: hypothetical protein VHJ37_14600 [Thermoleophilaceae bacterium]|nr:hypothetical protein [Thermoleophilaceae bacterium]